MQWRLYQGTAEVENIAADQTVLVDSMKEIVIVTMTVRESQYVGLTTVQSSLEEDGMPVMTAVRDDVLRIILAWREKVTVNMTLTVSTLAGQDVAMICVSTHNIFQLLSIQTTQLGLGSVPMIIAATECVTRTTTDVEMVLWAADIMKIVMMDITVTKTCSFQPAMN